MSLDRIAAYRLLARVLVNHACGGSAGRPESDPVYRDDVTEGRDAGAMQRAYSSCGDLAHWLLYRLGVRESWINRREHYRGWRAGENIAAFCWRPCPSRRPHVAERFGAGDVLVIYSQPDSSDAHALVVLEHEGDYILSGDYGQPGGALRRRRLSGQDLGGRTIQHVLTLPMALTGGLAPPDWTYLEGLLTGEELDACAQAIGYPLPPRPEAA
jgi:hypothetical protein